jgi:hypothetical protein
LKFDEGVRAMTEEKLILSEIYQLPEKQKADVLRYIEFLKQQSNVQTKPQQLKKRKAGSAKGKCKPAPDFDKPLEDFKEYM